MEHFSVNLAEVSDMAAFNNAMAELHNETSEYIDNLAKELGVSIACANDVYYLRTRSRHNEELERELIQLHSEGRPPNIYEFG